MTDRPRIAHLTTVDLSLRYLLLPQLTAPIELGIESYGISAPGPWVAELEARGIEHEPLMSSTRGVDFLADIRAALEFWRVLRRVRPTVLHTHNPKPGIYGRILGRLAGVPIVVNTVHGIYATEDDPLVKRVIVYLLEAIASRFSDAELVQSAEDVALMRRLRLAPRHRIRHLGNGVDLTHFDPDRFDPKVRADVRAEIGVDDDQILVGQVGRLVLEKGYAELIEAAEQLDDRFVVVCVGPEDPDKPDAVPPEIIERGRRAGVRFLGMRTDVERLYLGLDVFVLASHREGFPRAAMEAAAMGLPIVATDIRGCREVVDHGSNGFLVPVRDPGSLAAAIRELGDTETRKRMSEAARQKARESFDDRRIVDIVLGTYLELARAKGLHELASALAGRRDGEPVIRAATVADVDFLAGMHASAIATGFLPTLGLPFMRVLYRALVEDPDAVVLVAEDESGPCGFVAGVRSTGAFYRKFLRRHAIRAGLAAAPRMVSPSRIRRVWESLRYGTEGDHVTEAELLSLAVAPDRRGRGIGLRLGEELLVRLGEPRVRVVVGADNSTAIGAYRRMGFEPRATIEVHSGEKSQVLEWSR